MFAHLNSRHRRIVRVLILLLGVNLLVAGTKLAIGFWTGTLAVLADGFHSLLDGANNVIGVFAIMMAAAPADDEHPYGHDKFENIAALIIGGLICFVAFRLLEEAGRNVVAHLRGTEELLADSINWIAVSLVLATSVANWAVATYEHRRGVELESTLLTADAAHTRADIAVSVLGVVSLLLRPYVWWADPVLALVVLVFLGRAAWHILQENLPALTDRQYLPIKDVSDVVLSVRGVEGCSDIRSHGTAASIHLDLEIVVNRDITAREVEKIEARVRERLTEAFPGLTLVAIHHRTQKTQ